MYKLYKERMNSGDFVNFNEAIDRVKTEYHKAYFWTAESIYSLMVK